MMFPLRRQDQFLVPLIAIHRHCKPDPFLSATALRNLDRRYQQFSDAGYPDFGDGSKKQGTVRHGRSQKGNMVNKPIRKNRNYPGLSFAIQGASLNSLGVRKSARKFLFGVTDKIRLSY
jgi:hypothetical protein